MSKDGFGEFTEACIYINILAEESDRQYLEKEHFTLNHNTKLQGQFYKLEREQQLVLYPTRERTFRIMSIQSKGQNNLTTLEILFNNLAYEYESYYNQKNNIFNLKNLLHYIRNVQITHFTADLNGRLCVFLLRFRELIRYNQPLPLTLSSFHFTAYSLRELEQEHLDGISLANEFSLKKANEIIADFSSFPCFFKHDLMKVLSVQPLIAGIQINALYLKTMNQWVKNELISLYNELVEKLIQSAKTKIWNRFLVYHVKNFSAIPSPAEALYNRLSQHVIYNEIKPHLIGELNALRDLQKNELKKAPGPYNHYKLRRNTF